MVKLNVARVGAELRGRPRLSEQGEQNRGRRGAVSGRDGLGGDPGSGAATAPGKRRGGKTRPLANPCERGPFTGLCRPDARADGKRPPGFGPTGAVPPGATFLRVLLEQRTTLGEPFCSMRVRGFAPHVVFRKNARKNVKNRRSIFINYAVCD